MRLCTQSGPPAFLDHPEEAEMRFKTIHADSWVMFHIDFAKRIDSALPASSSSPIPSYHVTGNPMSHDIDIDVTFRHI
jgi:hypothetical protein